MNFICICKCRSAPQVKPTRGPRRQEPGKTTTSGRGNKSTGSKRSGDSKGGRGRDDKSSDRKLKKDPSEKKDDKVGFLWSLALKNLL